MLKRLLVVAALISLIIPQILLAAPEKDADAVKTPNEWLSVVDAGTYAESWEATSTYYRNAVTKVQRETALTSTRLAHGEILSRKVRMSLITHMIYTHVVNRNKLAVKSPLDI